MRIRVPVFEQDMRAESTGTTVVTVEEVRDPIDGVRKIDFTDSRMQEIGARVTRSGVSYAGEPDLAVVIPAAEPVIQSTCMSSFSERPA